MLGWLPSLVWAIGVVANPGWAQQPAGADRPSAGVSAPGALAPGVVKTPDLAEVYLQQSLSALARAEQLATQARQYGPLERFDLDRFTAELRQVSLGLQRYLVPNAPPTGPRVRVEITGQYLLEGLRDIPAPPSAQRAHPLGAAPEKEDNR